MALPLLLGAVSCSGPAPDRIVRIRATLPRVPGNALAMDCYFANVRGANVGSTYSSLPLPFTPQCLELGTVSALVSAERITGEGVSLRLRPGFRRNVQLVGIPNGGTSCAGRTLEDLLVTASPDLYVVAEGTRDLVSEQPVLVPDVYSSAATKRNLKTQCPSPSSEFSLHLSAMYQDSNNFEFEAPDTLWGDLLDFGLPPALSHPNYPGDLASADISSLPIDITSRVPALTSADRHARLDLMFSTSVVSVAAYSSLSLGIRARAGIVPAPGNVCDPGGTISLAGVEGRLYRSGWDAGAGFNDTTTTFSLSTINAPNPANFVVAEGGQPFIHLSLRNTTAIPVNMCGLIAVSEVTLKLVP